MEADPGVLPKHETGARALRALSWAQILLPIALVLVTLPGSLYVLLLGGIIIFAPPVGLGVMGLGIAKNLRAGHHVATAFVWALVHAFAYVALALNSRTWDGSSPGDERFYVACQVVFWIAAAGYLSVLFVLGSPTRTSTNVTYDPELYSKPKLWPWLLAGLLILALALSGLAVSVRSEP